MKTWQRPAAVGQEFAANDYVSACSYVTLNCSVTSSELFANFALAIPADAPEYFQGGEYRKCRAEVTVPVNELKECKFTHIADAWGDKPDTELKNPIEAYYWIGTKANGDPDFHAFPASEVESVLADSNKS